MKIWSGHLIDMHICIVSHPVSNKYVGVEGGENGGIGRKEGNVVI